MCSRRLVGLPAKTRPTEPALLPAALLLAVVWLALSSCGRRPPDGMALIPAGAFVMGTDELALEEEAQDYGIAKPWVLDAAPAQRVDLPAYFIDRLEVTNADYARFVAQGNGVALPHWKGGKVAPDQERLPVVFVNWNEAAAYCRWAGKRLPTEPEWEKAARGPDGRLYPWGNDLDLTLANVGGVNPDVVAVGSYARGQSVYGVMDLIGNVWEWTADWYQAYPGSRYTSDAFGQQLRVVRGNSFAGVGHFPPDDLRKILAAQVRSSYRFFFQPNGALGDVGFRCARDLKS